MCVVLSSYIHQNFQFCLVTFITLYLHGLYIFGLWRHNSKLLLVDNERGLLYYHVLHLAKTCKGKKCGWANAQGSAVLWAKEWIQSHISNPERDRASVRKGLSSTLGCIWVLSDGYNKNTMNCVTKLINISFLQFWSLGSLRGRQWQMQGPVKAHFLVHGQLSSYCALIWQKGRGSSLGSHSWRFPPPSRPNHFTKSSPPNPITLRIRFQRMNFVEDTNIQSTRR